MTFHEVIDAAQFIPDLITAGIYVFIFLIYLLVIEAYHEMQPPREKKDDSMTTMTRDPAKILENKQEEGFRCYNCIHHQRIGIRRRGVCVPRMPGYPYEGRSTCEEFRLRVKGRSVYDKK